MPTFRPLGDPTPKRALTSSEPKDFDVLRDEATGDEDGTDNTSHLGDLAVTMRLGGLGDEGRQRRSFGSCEETCVPWHQRSKPPQLLQR